MDDFITSTNLNKNNQVKTSSSKKKEVSTKRKFNEPLEKVTLSHFSESQSLNKKSTSTAIRQDLVKKFRRELDKGIYEVRAEEIADKIIQKVREEKDRIII